MHDTFQHVLFFLLSGLALVSAFMVVLLNNPVRCALALVVVFLASSGLWLLANAEFLALILVLVYVGAVMTLFLFVVMMLDIEKMSGKRYLTRYVPLGLIVVAILTVFMWIVIHPVSFNLTPIASELNVPSNTESLGLVLYTIYAYPLEIAAVLLLIAIIAAITLAHRPPRNNRTQQITDQIMVRKEDRLRVVKIDSQKRL